jgi:hypothetical protein
LAKYVAIRRWQVFEEGNSLNTKCRIALNQRREITTRVAGRIKENNELIEQLLQTAK